MFEKKYKKDELEDKIIDNDIGKDEEIEEVTNEQKNPYDSYYNFRDLKQEFIYGRGKQRMTHRPFGKFKRKLIFLLLFVINILINVDHGAIPAATKILKRDLMMDNISLGIIGSLVYLGLVFGAITATMIFQMYSSKWIVTTSLFISCFFLYTFTVSKNIIFLSISRIGCGFFQVNLICFI
jgi:hypothetical protein